MFKLRKSGSRESLSSAVMGSMVLDSRLKVNKYNHIINHILTKKKLLIRDIDVYSTISSLKFN